MDKLKRALLTISLIITAVICFSVSSFASCESGHSWNKGIVLVAATCTESGKKQVTCIVCSKVETISTEPTGHYPKRIAETAPTCTKTGLTSGKECSECGIILEKQELIPANGHDTVYYEAIVPTCENSGCNQGSKCSVCGEILTGLETLPPLGHIEETIAGKEASCNETGISDEKKCTVCGKITLEQKIIPAKGHIIVVDLAVSATCQNTGLTEGRHCALCGKVIEKQKVVPKTNHYLITTDAVSPTCTKPGKTASQSCAVCSLVVEPSKAVPALGHKLSATYTAASIKKDGEYVTSCRVCGSEISTTPIPKVKYFTLSKSTYDYTGKENTPTVMVKDEKNSPLLYGKDYTVSYASGRKEPGKYAVKITLMGNYTGSKTVYFTVAPGKSTVKFTSTTDSVTLSWSKVKGAYGYRVYLYNTRTAKWNIVIKATRDFSHTFKSLSDGTDYKYSVKAYSRSGGTVIWGEGKRITVTTKPEAPKISEVESATRGSATIKWNKVTGVTGYVVYYKEGADGTYKKLLVSKTNTLTKTGLPRGTNCYFKVKAYRKSTAGNLYSSASNTRSVYIK